MTQHHKDYVPSHHHAHQATTVAKKVEATDDCEDREGRSAGYEEVRLCAYQKWEKAGKPSGDGVEYWLAAEHELVHGM